MKLLIPVFQRICSWDKPLIPSKLHRQPRLAAVSAILFPLCFLAPLAHPASAEVTVAVYDAMLDGAKESQAEDVVRTLAALKEIKTEKIGELASARLLQYSAVIVPSGLGTKASVQADAALRAYVLSGGSLVLSLECAGGGYPPAQTDPVFPEIYSFRGELRLQKGAARVLRGIAPHPIAEGVDALKPSHHPAGWLQNNAVFVEPGPQAATVLADTGLPYFGVVVAGSVGTGRIVFWGMLFPPALKEQPAEEKETGEGILPTPDTEAQADLKALHKLFQQSVLWATSHKPQDLKGVAGVEFERLQIRKGWSRLEEIRSSLLKLRQNPSPEVDAVLAETERFLNETRDLWAGKSKAAGQLQTPEDAANFLESASSDHKSFQVKSRELSLKMIEFRRQLRLERKEPFDRGLPVYPRIICHLFSMVREQPSPEVADRYLREAAEELRANIDASIIENHYNPGEWFVDEKVNTDYLNLCELHGIQFWGWSARAEGKKLKETRAAEIYSRFPAFCGFLIDEPFYLFGKGSYDFPYPDPTENFKAFLKRYPPDVLKMAEVDPEKAELGQFNHSKEISDGNATPAQRVRWTMAGEFFRHELGGLMRNTFQGFKDADANLHSWTNLNVYEWFSYGQSLLDFAEFSDIIGFDPYRSGDFVECFIMDLTRAAARGKTIGIAFGGGEYTYFQQHYRRHLYNLAIHSDGIGLFTWSTLYKWQHGYSDERKGWSPGFWEMTCDVMRHLEKLEPYLSNRKSMARTAILVSERTMWTRFFVPWGARSPTTRYWDNLVGLYCLLRQQHHSVDFIFAEQLDRKLGNYSVLLAPEATSLTDKEIEGMKEWVRQGGCLIATSGTGTCDSWGIERAEYSFEDLFGARPKPRPLEKSKLAMADPPCEFEYAGPEPATLDATRGEVFLKWADGAAAGTSQPAGKGLAVLLGIPYLGLYEKGGAELPVFPETTRRGFESTLSAAFRKLDPGLGRPLGVKGASPETLLTDIRYQENPKRLVLCLLDYGPAYKLDESAAKSVPFKSGVPARLFLPQPRADVQLSLRLPEGLSATHLQVRLPLSGRRLDAKLDGKELQFTVPGFVLFECVVISDE